MSSIFTLLKPQCCSLKRRICILSHISVQCKMSNLPARFAHFAPISSQYNATAGLEAPFEQAQSSNPDTFTWCGAQYSRNDLEKAAKLLMRADATQDRALPQCSTDPWDPASWKVLTEHAEQLLVALADRRALPEVGACRVVCVRLMRYHCLEDAWAGSCTCLFCCPA